MVRSTFVALFLAVAVALFALASWGKAEINDPNQLAEQSAAALQSKQVRNLLADRIVDEVWDNVDTEKIIEDVLPADLQTLVAPADTASKSAARSGVSALLKQSFVQDIWQESVRVTHQNTLRALQNKQSALLIQRETLSLDTSIVLRVVARKLDVPAFVTNNIPDGLGTVELARTKSISQIQTAYQILEISPPLLLLLVAVFAALLVAINYRRPAQAGTWLAGATAFAGVIVLVVREAISPLVLGSFEDPLSAAIGRSLWQEWSASLGAVASWIFVVSVVLAVVSFLLSSWMKPWRDRALEESKKQWKKLRQES